MGRKEFEELLEPHMEAFLGYALRTARNRADAEDLLQESIYRAFRGRAGFRRGTNFKAWVFRIVTNTFISRRRKSSRDPQVVAELESVADPATSVERELEAEGTDWNKVYEDVVEDDMKAALDELPEEFRTPLLLSSLAGLRYKEIADVLEVPIGTVMSRLFRARQRLKTSLRDYAAARGIPVGKD